MYQIDGQLDGEIENWMDEWLGGQRLDEWMDGQKMEGQTGRQMIKQIHRLLLHQTQVLRKWQQDKRRYHAERYSVTLF